MQALKVQFVESGKSGFTLIELLVVIAIISLMASFGSGMFIGTLDKLKLDKAANTLLLTARYARMMAVEQQKRYRLCLDETNNSFYLITTLYDEASGEIADVVVNDPYCKSFTLDDSIHFEEVEIVPTGLDIDVAYADSPTVLFEPDGTAQTAVIQIGNGTAHYTLSINAINGRTKLISGLADDVKSSTIDLDAE